jgi:hypothetical protein
MEQPVELITNLFETLRLTHGLKLVFYTGRINENQENFEVSFKNGVFLCECSDPNEHITFLTANEFILCCLPTYVWISNCFLVDSLNNKTCVYFQLARTMTNV